jgi:hypothetical protein
MKTNKITDDDFWKVYYAEKGVLPQQFFDASAAEGKTIRSIHLDGMRQLVIVFTDRTFIGFEAEEDYYDGSAELKVHTNRVDKHLLVEAGLVSSKTERNFQQRKNRQENDKFKARRKADYERLKEEFGDD